MLKEKNLTPSKHLEKDVSAVNLVEAQLLKLPLPEQYDPLLQQSGPKLHQLAKLCRLGLCDFK
ncbi:MAG: hypothetical protein XD98_0443 [Microgenomates bacterium 39_6]|nr:MAG: hypothetical protein XD98_0443 [Microgenomates bacterium 39_6]